MDYTGINKLVDFIYGPEKGPDIATYLTDVLEKASGGLQIPSWFKGCSGERKILPFDEKDSVLITYGDQFRFRESDSGENAPLKALARFLEKYVKNSVSCVHILPFYPYSSDDGFSVIDYREVDPGLGSWKDIEEIGKNYRLMADLVLNHCSAGSLWFRKFIEWDSVYRDYFIAVKPGTDVSMVFRPRALPLLTPFETADGEKLVWTTFSADQVDLNYANPAVLAEMLSIFLFYVKKGISIIRLDAVAYLWKEEGHSCLHHDKTHAVVRLFREVARIFAPWVVIITETNVPHMENISYFGNGADEAHMVYQFALPPLTLDSFIREDASYLRKWALQSPAKPSRHVSFFNFTASHDGIGVLPAREILEPNHFSGMLSAVVQRGGLVSYKAAREGNIPYEMNINYRSAVSGDEKDPARAVDRFVASQAIMLSMEGVPGIYIHSLAGSLNYRKGVEKTGMNRTINREKFFLTEIESELDETGSQRSIIISRYRALLDIRKREKAFSPLSGQTILKTDGPLFAFLRMPPGGRESILCIYNISGRVIKSFPGWEFLRNSEEEKFTDIVTGRLSFALLLSGGTPMLTLEPWQFVWLKLDAQVSD